MLPVEIRERIQQLPKTDNKDKSYILEKRREYPRAYMAWTQEEDKLLQACMAVKNITVGMIAKELGRTESSIITRMESLDLSGETNLEASSTPCSIQQMPMFKKVIHYWRNSLADQDKIGFELKDIDVAHSILLTAEDLESGMLPETQVLPLFQKAEYEIRSHKRKKRLKDKDEEDVVIKTLQVLIAPYALVKKVEHGEYKRSKAPNKIFPLWIVASMHRSGRLSASESRSVPWLDRRCLLPNDDRYDYPVIGELADEDHFHTEHSDEIQETNDVPWGKLFKYALDLYRSVVKTDQSFGEYELMTNAPLLVVSADSTGISRNIINIYDRFLSDSSHAMPDLLVDFCSLDKREHHPRLNSHQEFLLSQRHYGQMHGAYPLSDSQRVSLSHLCDSDNIMTIHGPPGTGKTTLLASIVASMWVERALLQEKPPIIAIGSTNHQAVNNVLERFIEEKQAKDTNLMSRWLPNVHQFGLYLCSQDEGKIAKAKSNDFLYCTNKKEGDSSLVQLYEHTYISNAKEYFLDKFNHEFEQKCDDFVFAKSFLHERLTRENKLLQQSIAIAFEYNVYLQEFKQKYHAIESVSNILNRLLADVEEVVEKLKLIKTTKHNWLKYQEKRLTWPLIL